MSKIINDPYLIACKLLDIKPKPVLKDRTDKDKVSSDAYDRLIVCIRAKNLVDGNIWKPVYDGIECHYWPIWKPNKAGFGFSCTNYGCWYANTNVGSRLEYRSRQLAEEGAKEFETYYHDYYAQ